MGGKRIGRGGGPLRAGPDRVGHKESGNTLGFVHFLASDSNLNRHKHLVSIKRSADY